MLVASTRNNVQGNGSEHSRKKNKKVFEHQNNDEDNDTQQNDLSNLVVKFRHAGTKILRKNRLKKQTPRFFFYDRDHMRILHWCLQYWLKIEWVISG